MGHLIGSLTGLIAAAKRTAQRRKQKPTTAHALLAMLRHDRESSRILTARGVREMDLINALRTHTEEAESAVEVATERASRIASRVGDGKARPIHLLVAIVKEPRSAGYKCLEMAGAKASRVREDVLVQLGCDDERALSAGGQRNHQNSRPVVPPVSRGRVTTKPSSPQRVCSPPHTRTPLRTVRKSTVPPPSRNSSPPPTAKRVSASPRIKERNAETIDLSAYRLRRDRYPLLNQIGRNLTLMAAEGKIDPVIGRDKELDRLLDVLARRRSNNPVLVGPPGVGKTAIVEGLARRMFADAQEDAETSPRLVVEVSAGSLVRGTGVRGALAERIQKLRQEVAGAEGRILLFLDEIHALVGGEGSDELANELKASLARGELPCIGATTETEYRRHFERDAALVRRFSRIDVAEPSAEDAIQILKGIAPRYELHHSVAYDPSALTAAVELTQRYMTEGHLPDKAISVLDLAAARIRRRGGTVVDRPEIARIVAEQAHVPEERILMQDKECLMRLEEHLEDRVIGQDRTMARIADALRKGAAGFRGRRPLGTFLLLGPTGVGKTETAKAISDLMFPGSGMVRFDMSEFSEAHSVARLLGAPPGYVGHDDGGQLTEAVRRRPYRLILLDEVEKAHPDVLLALLPLLDEGRLTDGRGRTVDFTNTVIVMTSNLGAVVSSGRRRVGFGTEESTRPDRDACAALALDGARKALPPELWNRIDEPLYFGALGVDDVFEIAARLVDDVADLMFSEHEIALDIERSAIDVLVDHGYDVTLGARPMKRCVGRLIESVLASKLLRGEIQRGDEIAIRGKKGEICFERRQASEAAE